MQLDKKNSFAFQFKEEKILFRIGMPNQNKIEIR